MRSLATLLATACLLAVVTPAAAQQPTLTPDDYGRWENLGSTALSPDGGWIATRITRVNEENELRIRKLVEDSARIVPWGMNPQFSANSAWLAWAVEVSADERKRLEKAGDRPRLGVGVLNLRTEEKQEFEEVRSFSFDAEGQFLALFSYVPEDAKSADLRVLSLETGSIMTFGNVASHEWSDSGSLLALAIATADGEGNGVQLYDAATGRLRSLDASDSAYDQLTWRKDAADLAVMRSVDPAGDEGTAQEVLAWRGLDLVDPRGSATLTLNSETAGVADTLEMVLSGAPRWSEDGTMISVGLRPFDPEEEDAADEEGEGEEGDSDEGQEGGEDDEQAPEDSAEDEEEPELPGLQIWHSSDREIFAGQQARQSFNERRTLLAVWHVEEDRLVQVGTDLDANTSLLHGWTRAVELTSEPYAWGDMFGRPYHDTWLVDVATGERDMIAERVRYDWASDGGRWHISYDGANYAALNLDTRESFDLTSSLPTVFADTAYDTPTDVLPPHGFGPGGWLEGDAAVFLYDEHDIWRIAPDGSGATRITRGLEDDVTHRLIREFDFSTGQMNVFGDDDDEPGFDPNSPLYLSLYGELTEKRGYGRLMPTVAGAAAAPTVEQLVFEDRYISGLTKADSADVYMYSAQAFDVPPNRFIGRADLADARQVTDANPFISEYAWGRSELVSFVSEGGRDLQAVLLYPADYVEGTRVPMIVYTYEMLSPQMHFFGTPTERNYYNRTVWTQQGYAVLLPDIVYTAREPGVSAIESVRAAVAKVVEMGVADPEGVGLIGHSWGGYQATYLPTRVDIFAASVAGAPLTDFVSFMGAIHWNPGMPEVDHWETGQARMEVPFWDDMEAHFRNSPIHKVHEMETPLLMAFGNEDGVVDWDQGTEFYNFARRAGKQMVLIVYEGEDHGFRQEPNQVDYHRRILEWFGHYLKGEPAEKWITDGIPMDELEEEKKRVAKKGGS